ncbi:hypothetical protein Q5P01_009050 [Channa striata]|uniref:Ig-like domain-containing protein n=1 Tax=Channa striata TaxID=64152 RepID=A0AA88N0G6_CHASR|nr:hypothetical protein Q5P01_009050 [Channa striata]
MDERVYDQFGRAFSNEKTFGLSKAEQVIIQQCVRRQEHRRNCFHKTKMVGTKILLALFFGDLLMETLSENCSPAFQVIINSTNPSPKEGDDITLSCVHNISNGSLTFSWKKDGQMMSTSQNTSELVLTKVLSDNSGSYSCVVNSTYDSCESPPYSVIIENQSVIILVICGVSALLLILIMGLAMKFKLKRDNDKHKERRKQRVQGGQSGSPAQFASRES